LNTGLKVRSFRSEYEVNFVEDFLPALSDVLRAGDFLLLDENVARLYSSRLVALLATYPCQLITPSESQKSFQGIEPVMARLIQAGFRKNHRLVAIGGGVTQDVTAFIASVLYRGVDWLFVPTNLLSQCDSCIGSKTSINFGSFKNQLGGFHPPRLILSDQSFLETLPAEEIRSGMGEMMHYFLIAGRMDFDRLAREYDAALCDQEVLRGLIYRSLEIKRAMVEQDEFDEGPRNVFNYGHSFGHALESYSGFRIPHGIAVTFGMDLANWISVAKSLLSRTEAEEMRGLLERNWRPTDPGEVEVQPYLELLRKDKKNINGDVRVILSRGLGDMFITRISLDDEVRSIVQRCFEYYRQTATPETP